MTRKSVHNQVPATSLTLPPISLPLPPISLPITHSSSALLASLLFHKHVRYPPAFQSLCTCYSHCLEHYSSQILWWLAHPLPVCSDVTSLEKHSLANISKIAPFTSTFYPLILIYRLCFSAKHWSPDILHLFIVISVCLSPVDCKLHKAGTLVLFTTVFPVPRTVRSAI